MLTPLFQGLRSQIPQDASLILASTVGEIDLLERALLTGEGAPEDSLLTTLLGRVRRLSCVRGRGSVVSAACASSTAALAHAGRRIRQGREDAVLVVACDSVTEFVFSGFSSLMALDPERARPFDRGRKGLTLGEAAGVALVMSLDRARREDRPVLAEIAGWGLSGDANHMTGPSRDGQGLALAIEKAVGSAGISPDEIASICAHGTATVYNDAMEMKAFRRVFGGRKVPAYSVKGAIGHTLGAAGMIEVLLCIRSMADRVVPGTIGLEEPEDMAEGWVSPDPLSLRPAGCTLSTNSGFGGLNAALILRSGEDIEPIGQGPQPRSDAQTPWSSVGIAGIGWLDAQEYGGIRQLSRKDYADRASLETLVKTDPILDRPVKEFTRFDEDTKRTCYAVSLALQDAGILPAPADKVAVGILATGRQGCLQTNVAYFKDYLGSGRKSGRSRLFIYTLPSSPCCEAAILFGLQGPSLFMVGEESSIEDVLETGQGMLVEGEAEGMVIVSLEQDRATAYVLSPEVGSGPLAIDGFLMSSPPIPTFPLQGGRRDNPWGDT